MINCMKQLAHITLKPIFIGFVFVCANAFAINHLSSPIPRYFSNASEKNAQALFSLALLNCGIKTNGFWTAWPWTVYRDGKPVKLKDQRTLIKYIQNSPKIEFGLYGLTIDDFVKNNHKLNLQEFTNPVAQVQIIAEHFEGFDVNTLIVKANRKFAFPRNKVKIKKSTVNIASLKRNSNLHAIIAAKSKKYKVPVNLIKAVIRAESAFNRKAISSAGARGLMQVMPDTARAMGVNPKHLFIPEVAIEAGTKYLSIQLQEFKNINLALAAYNAGPGAVKKYHYRIPPYKETRNYVSKVKRFFRHYERISI